ncbi:MAG TPA: LUD domain-containing protein, partial [Modicisalibacter sp.]|nr:LUD domain-containing protein [Modicisalibacter sp.]
MSARDTILGRLRDRLDGPLSAPVSDFGVVTGRGWSHEERLMRFENKIASVHGEVIHTDQATWVAALISVLADKSIKRLGLGREHPVAQEARTALADSEIELIDADRDIESWQREQFDSLEAGLTSTRGAIAETGSLWLWPTPDEPRRLSLVPPLHIAVLDADAIEDTFFDIVEKH